MKKYNIIKILIVLITMMLFATSCSKELNVNNSNTVNSSEKQGEENSNSKGETLVNNENNNQNTDSNSYAGVNSELINVQFKLGKSKKYDNKVVEDKVELKKEGKEHSAKYFSYIPLAKKDGQDFTYFDVGNNERYMKINDKLKKSNYKWGDSEGVMSKKAPIGHKMSYGIDISKHNGNIDFKKVKNAGFEFVFIRIAYRGYGKAGNLKTDEMQEVYLKKAKEAGLKVGAYVFSQSVNESEAVEEAKLAIKLLKDYKLDLPLVYDPETIKGNIARTDDVSGTDWTKNAIAFCEEVKKAGFTPAIYSNMVWEDYYFDMEKLQDYEIWYADYNKLPQTPYDFKYWQFSEVGIVDGVKGEVDLNVMIE